MGGEDLGSVGEMNLFIIFYMKKSLFNKNTHNSILNLSLKYFLFIKQIRRYIIQAYISIPFEYVGYLKESLHSYITTV